MTTISITRSHALAIDAAREAAESVAAELKEKYGLNYAWDGSNLRFYTFGIRGELALLEAEVLLQARLGVFLLPFKENLEREINHCFDARFGVQAEVLNP